VWSSGERLRLLQALLCAAAPSSAALRAELARALQQWLASQPAAVTDSQRAEEAEQRSLLLGEASLLLFSPCLCAALLPSSTPSL
jgi:hypothetical protein